MSAAPKSSGIKLQSAPKAYSKEQDKARPPEETVAWVTGRFEAMGADVLRQVMRIDTGRLDIPVYISLCGDKASALTGTAKQMGKGASPIQSQASALMELGERFSFFSFIKNTDFPVLKPGQVDGGAMDFTQVAKSLYHPEESLEQARRVFDLLPQSWTWARNLNQDRDEMVPVGWFYAINEYNGPSAGNCLEEAMLQSLCEVVERHISAVVTLEERPTPAIDPASIDNEVALELMNKFQRAGIEVYIKDFTCDMGIPSVAALCYDPSTFPERSEIVYAAGSATTGAQALIRALTEVAQLAGDFNTASNYKVSALPKFKDMDEARYVTEAAGMVSLSSLPDVSAHDLGQEVKNCVSALEKRDFTLYTINVTHPVLGVPAVYSFIPGAHFAYRTTGTDVIFHAAKLASQLDDPLQAYNVLDEMSHAAGDVYYLHFFRALALINLERPAEGLESLDRALAMDPPSHDEASIHTQRGVALKELGRFEDAKEALIKAAGFEEVHHEVFNLLGFCHFKLQEYEEAVDVFGKAIEIEPGQAINYANVGANLKELGKIEEACQMYEHALSLDPALDWARENLDKLSKR